MLRNIFIQLWNRKRHNMSIFAELLCVFCIVWYITDYFFVYIYNCNLPNHRDLNHAWYMGIDILPESHPEYRVEEDEPETRYANYRRLVRAVEDFPGVEAVGVSFSSSIPAVGSYQGGRIIREDDTAKMADGQIIRLDVETDFLRVFAHTRNNGAQPALVSDFDWATSDAIVINRSVEQKLFPDGQSFGKKVFTTGKNKNVFRVVGVIDDVKRFYYQRPQNNLYVRLPISSELSAEWWRYGVSLSFRSRADISDETFMNRFLDKMTAKLRIGNFYLKSLTSYNQISDTTAKQSGLTTTLKMNVFLLLFLLVNILLCVFGTFWYRIHTRRDEVGLRKAMGATSVVVRNSLITEGLVLLVIAALAAIVIEFQYVAADLQQTLGKDPNYPCLPDKTWLRFLIANVLTFIILSVVIIMAIWFPAWRAAALTPSEALRDE